MSNIKTVGFIGIGVMGTSMAGHILTAGYPLHVYNRTKEKCQGLIARGAHWHDSVADLASHCDVVITMIGMPTDVEEVYFGKSGLIENAKPGAYLIDMTSSKPSLARKIYASAKARSLCALDAPVTGGDVGAKQATLTIMVGGDKEDFDTTLPILQLMGKNIVLQGGPGAGQHAKLCNQIAIASMMLGVCEALAYGSKAGLDQTTLLKTIESGAAGSWSLSNYGPRIIAGNFAPGFYVRHFIKDMQIAIDEAAEMGLDAAGLKLAKQMYEKLAKNGGADLGTHGLYKLYAKI